MTHIANCMRRTFDKPDIVYIMEETSSLLPCSGNTVSEKTLEKLERLEKQDQLLGQSQQTFKYQLWPRPSKASLGFTSPVQSDKTMALAMGRSPTSLSDTSVALDKSSAVWRRGGSLSNRRKISVPELGGSNAMVTVQEMVMDSPTIPGRPPLRKMASADVHHERSSSAPNWRDCVFGDAMVAGVSAPKISSITPPSMWALATPELPSTSYNPTRPLSPIFSPRGSTTPQTAFHIPSSEESSGEDVPPKVPPKSPIRKASSPMRSIQKTAGLGKFTKRTELKPAAPPIQPNSKPGTPELVNSPPDSVTNSPSTASEPRMSPNRAPQHNRTASKDSVSDAGMIDRGRPIKRTAKKPLAPPMLETTSLEIEPDDWKLPTGLKPMEATLVLAQSEKDLLRNQAAGQAEQFEVLRAKNVESLSRELRALDERCEYLRKTYKSLRSGRQKLHLRMITYLKTEAITFSRERLLKQEEALSELDKSIDDWILKLERAENRRLRLRQKLLEHVAAAMSLSPASGPPAQLGQATPPGSPPRVDSPQPLRVERKEVESIKVYADDQVLNLFTDIERAVERMCEAC